MPCHPERVSACRASRRTCICFSHLELSTKRGAPGLDSETWDRTDLVPSLPVSLRKRHKLIRARSRTPLRRRPLHRRIITRRYLQVSRLGAERHIGVIHLIGILRVVGNLYSVERGRNSVIVPVAI